MVFDFICVPISHCRLAQPIPLTYVGPAHALCLVRLQPLPRQSYGELREAGFLPKRSVVSAWSQEEMEMLREGLLEIRQKQVTMHTQDKYYFISHHLMGKRKTPGQCKAAVQALYEGRNDW